MLVKGVPDRLFLWLTTKEISKLRIIGPLWGNPPVTRGFPSQEDNNAETVTMPDLRVTPSIHIVRSVYGLRNYLPSPGELSRLKSTPLALVLWKHYQVLAQSTNIQGVRDRLLLTKLSLDTGDGASISSNNLDMTMIVLHCFRVYTDKRSTILYMNKLA